MSCKKQSCCWSFFFFFWIAFSHGEHISAKLCFLQDSYFILFFFLPCSGLIGSNLGVYYNPICPFSVALVLIWVKCEQEPALAGFAWEWIVSPKKTFVHFLKYITTFLYGTRLNNKHLLQCVYNLYNNLLSSYCPLKRTQYTKIQKEKKNNFILGWGKSVYVWLWQVQIGVLHKNNHSSMAQNRWTRNKHQVQGLIF